MLSTLNRRSAYFIFALFFFIFWFLFKVGGMPNMSRALFSTLIDIIVTMAAMILTVELLLPKFIDTRKYGLFFFLFFATVFIGGSVIIISQLYLEGSSFADYPGNVARYKQHYFYWFWADLIFGSYFLVFFISATGTAIRFAFDKLKAANIIGQLEKDKTTAALAALKNQIHPHFLFNALNTIYYKIERTNTDAREIFQNFSDILRYQLYECDTEFIEIEKELQFLIAYIELQKARLNSNYKVIYEGFETANGYKISPFLLMPIIENCFKHVSHIPNSKNSIHIQVKTNEHTFALHTANTIEPKFAENRSGIGLQNIKKRLEILYPGRHTIETKTTESLFELNLILQLA